MLIQIRKVPLFLLLTLAMLQASGGEHRQPDPTQPMSRVAEKLLSVKSLSYHHTRELRYPSSDYHNTLSGSVFLDFTSIDKIIGLRYFFENDNAILAFNGTESFECDKKNRVISINKTPVFNTFSSLSFLNHSMLTLRKALPGIIADKNIRKRWYDTVLDKKKFYVLGFDLKKAVIGNFGEQWTITQDLNIRYRIIIDTCSFLPVKVIQSNNVNEDVLTTIFSDIKTDIPLPDESVLYYSTYLKSYKEENKEDLRRLLEPGSKAPSWELPAVNEDTKMSLNQLKGKLVLLEFWISHCSYCISAVSGLNELNRMYKGNDFQILGINAYDSREIVLRFQKRHNVEYQLLYDGKDASIAYGVPGFPAVVLIDKKGTVIYAGRFDKEKLKSLIEKHR